MKKTRFPKRMWILISFACITFNIHAVVHITAPLASEYSWYYNGELIPGENDRILRAGDAGVYVVEMVKEDGSKTNECYNLSASGTVRKLIFIGDSTASMYDINRFPRTGWAQLLPKFFDDSKIQVLDKARSGSTTASFYSDNDWFSILPAIEEGDFVFIQFGLNDAVQVPLEEFKGYLKKYVHETREKGGIPVLCTPISRNFWDPADTTKIVDKIGDYPLSIKHVASEEDVPLLDIETATKTHFESLGKYTCTWDVFMNLKPGEYPYTEWADGLVDNSHLKLWGAMEVCKVAVEVMRKHADDKEIAILIPALQDAFLVNGKVNIPLAGVVTGNSSYAHGEPVSLRAVVKNPDYVFENWTLDDEVVSTSTNYKFVMGDSDISLSANFRHITSSIDKEKNKNFVLSPNPATDFLHIRAQSNILSCRLFDLAGKNILSSTHNDQHIALPVKELIDGMYIIHIETEKYIVSRKFIVKHER